LPSAALIDYHIHSTYSEDGRSSPEECARVAASRGLGGIIFTEHLEFIPPPDHHEPAYVPSRVLPADEYRQAVENLRDFWAGKLSIGMGVELGLESHNLAALGAYLEANDPRFDLVLGSLHAIGGCLAQCSDYVDPLGPVEAGRLYLERLAEGVRAAVRLGACDVIGHLDLVKRCDSFGPFLPGDYRDLLGVLLGTIVEAGLGLEVNTSGYRQAPGEPYPGLEILKWYRRLGGETVTVGSDSHSASTVGLESALAIDFVREAGFRHIALFSRRRPRYVPI
jgi:histidinol-phosphatase (PHP family)